MPGERQGEWGNRLRDLSDEVTARAATEANHFDADRLHFLADLLKIASDIADVTDDIEVYEGTPLSMRFTNPVFREMIAREFPTGLGEPPPLGPLEGYG